MNNAGATQRGDFLALAEDDWADGFALKFFAAVRLCRAAWPHLTATRGSVVNVAGVGGRTGSAEFTIGGAVNAAMLNLTKCLADRGVRVNAVTLTATDLGEFVRHHLCDRRFHLAVHEAREVAPLPFFDRLRDAIDPVLAEVGRRREDQWEAELVAAGFRDLAAGLPKGERDEVTWAALATALASLPAGVGGYARQVGVGGTVGAFRVYGLVDFLVARWDGGTPRLTLVECKVSRRDRTYHRVQVAVYRTLLRGLLGSRPVAVFISVAPDGDTTY